MKVFDFECSKCKSEKKNVMVDIAETVICDNCHSEMSKLITFNGQFVLKGEGFYKKGIS